MPRQDLSQLNPKAPEIPEQPQPPRLPFGPPQSLVSLTREFEIRTQLNMAHKLPLHLQQLRRKLHLRAQQRLRCLPMFNLDAWMDRYFDPKRPPPQPMPFSAELQTRVCMPDGVWRELTLPGMSAAQVLDKFAQVRDVRVLPYARSVLRRIQGDPALRSTLTVLEPRTSPYTGKRLQPYILRDYAAQPPKKAILETIASRGRGLPVARAPVDLVYFHEMHLQQANDLLSRTFWPGIDVSENLLCPDFSVVALYKRLVVGCAFMTPGGYITFIAVAPGWERCGIASRMLFHLVRKAQAVAQDVTLHVSANNRAMLLYQKFGFKPEGFIVGFYDQYLPEDSPQCKNAVFARARNRW